MQLLIWRAISPSGGAHFSIGRPPGTSNINNSLFGMKKNPMNHRGPELPGEETGSDSECLSPSNSMYGSRTPTWATNFPICNRRPFYSFLGIPLFRNARQVLVRILAYLNFAGNCMYRALSDVICRYRVELI